MRPAVSKSASQDWSPRTPNCPELPRPLPPPPRDDPLPPRRADELELLREKPRLPSAFTSESAWTP